MGSEQRALSPSPVNLAYLVFVYKAPDARSYLTGKQDHKAGEELGERGQSLDQQAQA